MPALTSYRAPRTAGDRHDLPGSDLRTRALLGIEGETGEETQPCRGFCHKRIAWRGARGGRGT
jgi:hypothetical protein